MPKPANDNEFLKRVRKRARNRFIVMAVLLAFAVGGVVWRGITLLQRMSQPTVEEVRVFVAADLSAGWDGRTYGKDEVDRLLAEIAAKYPGAYVLVCAPDVRNPTGAMIALWSVKHGLKGGLVRQTDARCKP
ncbi:MAG TPA: hypothetical protein VGK67_34645 [Myxococcales bacterium]|jgi:hypothetical protein